jgi:hypothetical protein
MMGAHERYYTVPYQSFKERSNDTQNRKILVFQPNFTTVDLNVVFILPGMAGVAGGLSLPRQVAAGLHSF